MINVLINDGFHSQKTPKLATAGLSSQRFPAQQWAVPGGGSFPHPLAGVSMVLSSMAGTLGKFWPLFASARLGCSVQRVVTNVMN